MVPLILSCAVSAELPNRYIVHIDETDLRSVNIEAELNLNGKHLSMDWPSVSWLEKGWAEFILNLKIEDSEGNNVEYRYMEKARWALHTSAKRVRCTYQVQLNHDRTSWEEGGHSAATYVLKDLVYSIGAALFIANPVDDLIIGAGPKAEVHFNLPGHYHMAVPWKVISAELNQYEVNSTYELIRSGLSYGSLKKSTQKIEGMEIVLSSANDFKEVIPLFQDIYDQIVPIAIQYFGSKPDRKYVVIANNAPRTSEFEPYFSGEALHQTMSLISPIVPTPEYMPLFWYILTHEYCHNWMGITIQANPKDQAWFMEGFTDYISWKILHEVGQIPQEMVLNGFGFGPNSIGWGENIKKYLAVAGSTNMIEAGKNKSENYDLIYSGGSLFALLLDIELLQATNGKKGLREYIQEINHNFGAGNDTILKHSDLKQKAIEIGGTSLESIFKRYVEGIDLMPIQDYLQKIGIQIDNFGKENQHLSVDPRSTKDQKKLLEKIMGS